MGIRLNDYGYFDLKEHYGHTVRVVGYGDVDEPANIALECEDCSEVIVSFDQPFFNSDNKCRECGCDVVEDSGEVYCRNEQCEHSVADWGSIGEPS